MNFRGLLGSVVLSAALGLASLASAADLAVIITNERYSNYSSPPGLGQLNRLQQDFRNAGFDVVLSRNLTTTSLAQTRQVISSRMRDADRIVVVVGGHFVSNARDSWLLVSDAGSPNPLNLANQGISLGAVLDILKQRQGEALLAVATGGRAQQFGEDMRDGYVPRRIPQGVTVAMAEADLLSQFLTGTILQRGQPMSAGADQIGDGLRIHGFLPRRAAFLPDQDVVQPEPVLTPEERLWRRATADNAVQSFQLYLDLYPDGIFAAEARQHIEDLTLTPEDRARIAEEQIGLSRDQRRQIQRNLS